ncbi:unnamed protein product [Didymodactylos carnosus]|uniref:ADP-ribosylation factor n=1 Tax=Didymodactylos carnosus TaxID=1234261 RepID=A0A814AID1_9BILA|nr:unnamed protein product [Didymodactylos carnosus]CAF0912291.1 unnamed protein product [Didymodactylos carnosus]CAF3575389.1 unnamed protein product [Didymodactylos carnosus]CAF3693154.1 unnamed protein product [Didymodactylos carnosus]
MGNWWTKLYDAFASLGADKEARILMLGLDAAGKTTILYKIKLNENLSTIPTIGFNVETVSPCRGVSFTVWDVGGQEKIRQLWRHYYQGAEGLMFVIDSNDHERLEEAKSELNGILNSPDMSHVPLVVIANKQDLPHAMSCSNIIEKLDLNSLNNKHRWYIQGACATTGDGLLESMIEMARLVKEYRKSGNDYSNY